jgi:2-polyprenyl-3-methyl-5-hydroxy-6-metoxy-1,4-benzoquinol methylase
VLVPGVTAVSICEQCGHSETSSIFNLENYYDSNYKIGGFDVDDDDLYSIEDGQVVYRSEHMARVFLEKTVGFNIKKLLDYGCGKSLVSKRVMTSNDKLDFFLFDVSRDYVEFWKNFRSEEQCAFFDTPRSWDESFDCVTSFFSLEHVPSPRASLTRIRRLLKDDGLLYAVVPNMYSVNRADLLVVDHLHHYSRSSMRYCLSSCGFDLLEIDEHAHQQASIFIAKAIAEKPTVITTDPLEVINEVQFAYKIADYWKTVEDRLRDFEEHAIVSGLDRVFIFGAGIIGVYLYSKYRNKKIITGFIDSNVHKQKKLYCGLPVFSPQVINLTQTDGLLVGLNAGVGETVIGPNRRFDQISKNIFYC